MPRSSGIVVLLVTCIAGLAPVGCSQGKGDAGERAISFTKVPTSPLPGKNSAERAELVARMKQVRLGDSMGQVVEKLGQPTLCFNLQGKQAGALVHHCYSYYLEGYRPGESTLDAQNVQYIFSPDGKLEAITSNIREIADQGSLTPDPDVVQHYRR